MAGYSLVQYGEMLADRVRTSAYVRAMEETIKAGDVVLDLGAGPGFFAIKAALMDARKVYAIEPNPSIALGRELAHTAGVTERVEFIHALSTEVELPEKADVIVADLRGALPLYDGSITTIADARDRLLAPGGTFIPLRDDLYCAPTSGALSRGYSIWTSEETGLDLTPGAKYALNTWDARRVDPSMLAAGPRKWASIDYLSVDSAGISGRAVWKADHPFEADGLCLWFETELIPGIGYSSGPLGEATTYRMAFFPLSETLRVDAGGQLEVEIESSPIGDSPAWTWQARTVDAAGAIHEPAKQSSLLSMPIPR